MKIWITKTLAIFAMLMGVMLMESCYDPCKGISCLNGNCTDGKCECEYGFEGPECNKAYNSKIFGSYTYGEICFPSGEYIDEDTLLEVTAVPNTKHQFKMNRIWGTDTDLICTFDTGGRYFTFPDSTIEQEVPLTTYLEGRQVVLYRGEVSEDGSQIDLIYRVRVDSVSPWMDSCSAKIVRY